MFFKLFLLPDSNQESCACYVNIKPLEIVAD